MRTHAERRAPQAREGPRQWLVFGAVALLVLASAAVLLMGRLGPGGAGGEAAAAAKVKGDPNAPVTVEEWGDFQ